jgi:hypothetical protein
VTEGRRRTPAVAIASTAQLTANELRSNLWRALRQQNLRRIAGEMRDDVGLAQGVEIRLKLARDDAEFPSERATKSMTYGMLRQCTKLHVRGVSAIAMAFEPPKRAASTRDG